MGSAALGLGFLLDSKHCPPAPPNSCQDWASVQRGMRKQRWVEHQPRLASERRGLGLRPEPGASSQWCGLWPAGSPCLRSLLWPSLVSYCCEAHMAVWRGPHKSSRKFIFIRSFCLIKRCIMLHQSTSVAFASSPVTPRLIDVILGLREKAKI